MARQNPGEENPLRANQRPGKGLFSFEGNFTSLPPAKGVLSHQNYKKPEYFPGHYFPRLQILTIEELLAGKELQYPRTEIGTFKKAESKGKGRLPEQERLL